MLNQLSTFFLSIALLAGLIAATPINDPRTLPDFKHKPSHWRPIYIPKFPKFSKIPWLYLPIFPKPTRPCRPCSTTTTIPGPPTSLPITQPGPSTIPPTTPPSPSTTFLTSSTAVVPNPSTTSLTVPPVPPTTSTAIVPTISTTLTTAPPVPPTSSTTTQQVPPTSTPVNPNPGTSIPFGEIISDCVVEGTVAITFDDGPFQFTSQLLDIFQQNNAKATLFVNGQNFGSITEQSAVIQRAFNEGHQLGSHTFGHKNLPDLNRDELVSEMKQLDDALFGIIGRRPTYMRAPFFAYSDLVLQTMKELQYHVIDASVDTKDFENNTPEGVPTSVQLFKQELDEGGTIALAHDVHQTTVQLLAQQMLDEVKRRGLRPVTVGECLGDPPANWYRT